MRAHTQTLRRPSVAILPEVDLASLLNVRHGRRSQLDASTFLVSEVLARAGFRDAVPTAREATTPHRGLLEPGHQYWLGFRAGLLATKWQSSEIYWSFRSLPNLIRVAAELCRPKNYVLWFAVILSELP